MTYREKLDEFIEKLDTLSTALLVQVLHEVHKQKKEKDREKSTDTDTATSDTSSAQLAVATAAALMLLRKRQEKEIEKFLLENDLRSLFDGISLETGYDIGEDFVEELERTIRRIPVAGERAGKDIVKRLDRYMDALEHTAQTGIHVVAYDSGKTASAYTHVKNTINTIMHQKMLKTEADERAAAGTHLVYCRPRSEACMKCIPWLGVVMWDDTDGTPVPEGVNYPRLTDAIQAGLLHPNCRDTVRTYTGQDTRPLTRAERASAIIAYKKTQHINYIKRNIKKYDVLYKATGEERYRILLDRWTSRLHDTSHDTHP